MCYEDEDEDNGKALTFLDDSILIFSATGIVVTCIWLKFYLAS